MHDPLADRYMAVQIRHAVDVLNSTLDAAQTVGLQVSFTVSTYVTHRPQKSHVVDVKIERPADRALDLNAQTTD